MVMSNWEKWARSLFDEITDRNVVSWTSLIYGYCHLGYVEAAKSLFDSMPRKNLVSWNVMIGGYSPNKQPHEALKFFHELQSTTSLELDGVTVLSILPCRFGRLEFRSLGSPVCTKEEA